MMKREHGKKLSSVFVSDKASPNSFEVVKKMEILQKKDKFPSMKNSYD